MFVNKVEVCRNVATILLVMGVIVARLKRKAWYLDTRGFILKKIQWHIHTGSWSLVNCWRALYKVLMNINECGCRPHGWPRP